MIPNDPMVPICSNDPHPDDHSNLRSAAEEPVAATFMVMIDAADDHSIHIRLFLIPSFDAFCSYLLWILYDFIPARTKVNLSSPLTPVH